MLNSRLQIHTAEYAKNKEISWQDVEKSILKMDGLLKVGFVPFLSKVDFNMFLFFND